MAQIHNILASRGRNGGTTYIKSQLAAVKERSDTGYTRKPTNIITASCAATFGGELAADTNLDNAVRALRLHAGDLHRAVAHIGADTWRQPSHNVDSARGHGHKQSTAIVLM